MALPQIKTENVVIKEENIMDASEKFCVCCLQQTRRYYKLTKCDHVDFLDTFPVPKILPPLNLLVCYYCHSMLKKLKQFKQQVKTSFEILIKEAANFTVQKHKKSRLTIHKTVSLTVPDKTIKRKTVLIPKKKNIETALEIIQNNATSLQALTSNNLKTMTDALLTVASGHLNLEPQNAQPVFLRTDHDYTKEVIMPEIEIESIKTENDLDLKKEHVKNKTLSGTELPCEMKKAEEVEVTIEGIYGTSVLPVVKIEPQEDELNCMEENSFTDSDEDLDQTPPNAIVAITLTTQELEQERLTTLQSHDYLLCPFRCDNCLIVFNFKENFEDHLKRKHEIKKGRVVCEICQQLVPNKELNNHILRHYERLECSQCRKRFALYDEAHEHYKTVHMLSKRKVTVKEIDNHSQRKRQKRNEENEKMVEGHISMVYNLLGASSSSIQQLIPSE